MSCKSCVCISTLPVLYETHFWAVQLADEQTYLGRCYVTLRRHAEDLADLRVAELRDWHDLVVVLEAAARQAFGARIFNWQCLMNDAYQDDPPQPHVHWHVRPRYDHPVCIGGEVFEDREFGHHIDRSRSRIVSEDLKEQIAERYRKVLFSAPPSD